MISIRQRLTRNLLFALAFLIAAACLAVCVCVRAALQKQFETTLKAKAQALVALTEQDEGKIQIEFFVEEMPGFARQGDDFFELKSADGKTVACSPSLEGKHLPDFDPSSQRPAIRRLTIAGRSARAICIQFRPRASDEHPERHSFAEATLLVASEDSDLNRTLQILQWVLTGGGGLLLAATGLVVPTLLRRELRPLDALAARAAQIDAASLDSRFPEASLAELVPITRRLNELLTRLQNSFERERRFSADVAHEFRTPIAELRCLAELAIKLPERNTAETPQEILAIALHLESVIGVLLSHARGETNELAARHERIDLSRMVEEMCQRFAAKASERRLAFDWAVPARAEVISDPTLLHSILRNLLENAVEYCPAGGLVNVKAEVSGGGFYVRIANTAHQLTTGDVAHLFERFWRKDAARTVNGHTGLGLSLSQAFARCLDCELTARLEPAGELVMALAKAPSGAAGSALGVTE